LSDLEQRNGSLLAVSSGKGTFDPPAVQEYTSIQPKLIIACNDQFGRYNVSSVEVLEELYTFSRNRSEYAVDFWPQVIVPQCRNLRFMPPEGQRFYGEISAPQKSWTTELMMNVDFKKVNTSTPILFINNVIDPVTLSHDKMAQFFEGAVVLLQDGIAVNVILLGS
jgi:hypothetical protein